jgi:hypothetical protein
MDRPAMIVRWAFHITRKIILASVVRAGNAPNVALAFTWKMKIVRNVLGLIKKSNVNV